jgi:hypothetical protein
VQRRLTDIHSGHFVSLHKLQRQCGDLSGELWPVCGIWNQCHPVLAAPEFMLQLKPSQLLCQHLSAAICVLLLTLPHACPPCAQPLPCRAAHRPAEPAGPSLPQRLRSRPAG